jgi:membrane protein implicated in regulation of membrane protease activity
VIQLDWQKAAAWLVLAIALAVALLALQNLSLRMTLGIAAAVCAYLGVRRLRRKYDLNELRRIHERAEVEGGETHYCPSCAEAYSAEFPVCPNCGRR